jgi:ABC-2 type transport system ATP-binding protein
VNPYLQISGLTKRYGAISALANVNFTIERGSVVAVLGPNGAGKSTLFGCLLGLTLPSSGSILLKNRSLTDGDRARIGYVAERVALYPQRTVAENAVFFARLRGQNASAIENELKRVGLTQARNRKVGELSKGMLQRLGLAIALCGYPDLLVLDEPFNGLDPALLDTLQSVLLEERRRGATLLVSTHTMSAVEPLATHVAILLQGRLAAFATLDGLRADYGPDDSLESIYHHIACEHGRMEEALA